MPKGYSLHIGVNEVDNHAYGIEVMPLVNCLNDAKAMADIALKKGYTKITLLLNKRATLENFSYFIQNYANELEEGDIFLLSFSGHGIQLDTIAKHIEMDDIDEGWCLHDKFIRDKDFLHHLKLFKKGVRIVIVSDSCFSGGMLR